MQETKEPAGLVSAVITGSAFGLSSFILFAGIGLPQMGARFGLGEGVVLGAMFGVALHLFGKIRSHCSSPAGN